MPDSETPNFDRMLDDMIMEYLSSPPSADEIERAERWRNATEDEHAQALSGLLHLVAGIGRPSVKQDMFPGLLSLSPKYRALYGKQY
ncbi:MAG: hypothetical protein HYX94_12290 [Chloroflexi bacterium]|nr:hypothetical protein [Chloroflexota bacterium]